HRRQWNHGVPPPLARLVGMPSVEKPHETSEGREHDQKRDPGVGKSGKSLDEGRQPERNRGCTDVREHVGNQQQEDTSVAKGVPYGVPLRIAFRLPFGLQLLRNPLPFIRGEPARFFWPIRHVEERHDSQRDGGYPLDDEDPSPTGQTLPSDSQEPTRERRTDQG